MNEKQLLTLLNGAPFRKFTIAEQILLKKFAEVGRWITETGNPLSFLGKGARLLQHYIYSCSLQQNGTPTPTSPKPLICSNGAISYRNKITIDGTEYVLPADVQMVEYAKFDGVSTKVDTGLTEYKNTYKYLIGIKRYSTTTKFVSFQNPDNTKNNIGMFSDANGYNFQNGAGTRRQIDANTTSFHDIVIERDGYTIDGNKQSVTPVAEFTISNNLHIGCASNNSSIDTRYTEDAISYFAVINGTTTVYIGVPVYKANGDFAWLDLVSGTYSTITGTLTAGNKVAKEMVALGRTDNLIDLSTTIDGYYYNDGGVYTQTDDARITDFIEAYPYTAYTFSAISGRVGSPRLRMCFFNSNKEYISQENTNTSATLTAIAPSGTKYVRVSANYRGSLRINWETTVLVKDSTVPTEYIPYWSLDGEKGKAKLNNVLPTGYTLVEYIEATGTQYIDTGISPANKKIGAVIDFQFTATSRSTGGVFGSKKIDNTDNCQFIVYNSKWRVKINNYATSGANYDTNRHIARCNMPNGTSLDDTVYTSTQYTVASENTNNVYVGACNYGSGSTAIYTLIGKLYSAKVYDYTTLVRDYVPAKDSSNVVGLYDKVSGQFFTNAGTGDFTAGPELPNGTIIDLPTIIKGNIDLVTGQGTEEWGIKVLDGTENWSLNVGVSGLFQLDLPDSLCQLSALYVGLCSHYIVMQNKTASGVQSGECTFQGMNGSHYGRISIRDSRFAGDLVGFKQMVATQYANGTPMIVCFPKSTAIAISVTPVALRQKDGQNEASATLKELRGSLSVLYYGEEEQAVVGTPLRMVETENTENTKNTESEAEDNE